MRTVGLVRISGGVWMLRHKRSIVLVLVLVGFIYPLMMEL